MTKSPRNITIYFVMSSILIVPLCMILFSNTVDAFSNLKTLESIINQTGSAANIPQISVGDKPSYIFGLKGTTIYVANSGSGTVSVIDTNTKNVAKTIPVGDNPSYIFGDSKTPLIYVANRGSGTVSVIDTNTKNVTKTIPVGDNPSYIFGARDGRFIYVANWGSVLDSDNDTLSVIDRCAPIPSTNVLPAVSRFTATPSSPYVPIVIRSIPRNSTLPPSTLLPSTPPSTLLPYTPIICTDSRLFDLNITTPSSMTKTIPVGDKPSYISGTRTAIYVANLGSGTVSVINPYTYNVTKTLRVGDKPSYISGTVGTIYVANSGSGTVSVIDEGIGDRSIANVTKTIPVGDHPTHIYDDFGTIYVANYYSNGVSLINPVTKNVEAGVTFNVSPFGTGDIICSTQLGDLNSPINQYFYLSSGAKCAAKPRKGFEFSSWGQVLQGNSTRTVNASLTSGSPWTALLDTFNFKSDDPAATLTVNRFGNFTAYFRALPPPVPAEYWASLFTVVVTALVGSLLIPATVGWFKSKKQTSRLNSYHQEMTSVYNDGKLDESDTKQLNTINRNISDSYAAGKINNEQYTNLKNEVSIAYQEIFKKRIEAVSSTVVNGEVVLERTKEDIQDAYSKGKITKLHYDLLNEKISKMKFFR